MSTRSFFDELTEDLTIKIGRAVWEFAKIESLTYDYIREIGGEPVYELVADLNFTARVKVVKKLVAKHRSSPDRVLELLDDAIDLASERNTIVHNPWSIYVNSNGEFVSEIQKYTNPDHSFTAEQIEKFFERARVVEESLRDVLYEI